MNLKKYIILFIFPFFISLDAFPGYINGTIRNQAGEPLPYASVFVKNTSYGVVSNLKGEYFLELKPGKYHLTFSYLGYETLDKTVIIDERYPVKLDIVMIASTVSASQVEIVAFKTDKAKEIMKNVRRMRRFYSNRVKDYSCITYLITSLEKELVNDNTEDGLYLDTSSIRDIKTIREYFNKERFNLIESFSKTYYQSPSKFKEIILSYHDYSEKKRSPGRTLTIGVTYGPKDIIPTQAQDENPYLIYKNIFSCEFNFYKNLIDYPALSQKPLLSPIAASGALSYTYKYLGSFNEQGHIIHKIEVRPIFKGEALFSGIIFIEDSTWALKAVDLSINKSAMQFCKDFRIIQDYELINDSSYMPVRRELIYTIRSGKYNILGNTRINFSDYKVNVPLPDKIFDDEIIKYEKDAFDKDSVFWNANRPIPLKSEESKFIKKSDSASSYFTSKEYYRKIDSQFNRLSFWSIFLGAGHRNRFKGTEFYIYGLLGQINPFGIGGYRHRLPCYFNKEFKNNYLLETDEVIDYGFNNNDVKGKIGFGLTYIPKKFVRTFLRFGDFYEQINDYASFEQTFSRSNYVRTKSISIAQKMEIVNGLFGELTFEYSEKTPIINLKSDWWSDTLFGKLNTPVSFTQYVKSEIKLELKYHIRQKYLIKDNKKIIIGTKYPEIRLIYRKGIPGLFGSEVNFDYLEIGAGDEMKVARLGISNWKVSAGAFINKNNLRLLEYKYFRGSDHYVFSDPLKSFQLLGPTLSTANNFLSANYIHHFNGSLLGKIPLINKLKMDIAAGAGALLLSDSSFIHFEMFAGIEKTFRIGKQLFRFGVYGVTAENTVDPADFTLKFGLDFFNTFTNKWSY